MHSLQLESPFLVISRRMLIVSSALIYDDAIKACAVSTVSADRTGKLVLLTYSLTASRCSTEAHLAGVPFPRSFDSRLALRQSCSARLKSLVWFGCKQIHRFRILIKAFLVKKKETKTAVLSRVAKLRSVVALLHGWTKWSQHCDRTPQRLRNETDKSFSFRNRITLVFESCSRSLTIY